MGSVFFSGSISIKRLPERIIQSINQINEIKEFEILVGDAAGFDSLLQDYCEKIGFTSVTVYSVNDTPRNFVNSFNFKQITTPDGIKSERKRQTYKDEQMTADSNISFVVWDEQSKGSYNNILRALKCDKKVRVFSTRTEQPINDITIDSITRIYHNSNGLTATELLDILYTKGVKEFDSVKQLNSFLVEQKYVLKVIEGGKSTYKTANEIYSFDIVHRGKHSSAKFKYELAELLIHRFKSKDRSDGYGSIRG
ncbi:hypothetical protein [Shewanella phaeophyticola]|uniref:Uncharacterized protein n=1 Tax=Shewanella phaeophyticola TaxID=2978345 RepID=A0ABT2P3P7_9GAMM|nr:hypothetical protein [Shewanella sp. KJ10-1]MCT8986554.1 hypothetical protein [Shewanella sp. KJ10-1]